MLADKIEMGDLYGLLETLQRQFAIKMQQYLRCSNHSAWDEVIRRVSFSTEVCELTNTQDHWRHLIDWSADIAVSTVCLCVTGYVYSHVFPYDQWKMAKHNVTKFGTHDDQAVSWTLGWF